ncbi:MAG: DUF4157 domain-containing protein [Paracoccaceae bacterium]
MAVTAALAVRPMAFASAPPVLRKAEPSPDHDQMPGRLVSSLGSVPGVQRACAACGGDDDDRDTAVMPRLEVGPVDDPYEREADSIAGQVMAMRGPNAVQRSCSSCGGDDTLVMPRLQVGPVDDPYETEADAVASSVMAQRSVQRAPDGDAPEIMARRVAVQRKCSSCGGDDLPVMPRRRTAVVRRASGLDRDTLRDLTDMPRMKADGAAGTEHIAASAGQLTSGGSALSPQTQSFFESRMGRDLSDVRIHRGSTSDRLNASIASRAFAYQNHVWLSHSEAEAPSFTMAHELAHVLQQTQPGQVRPKVRRARTGIIGETLYFGENPAKKTDTHDLVVEDAVKRNPKLMGEVAVPNAQRGMASVASGFGYADLVLSTPNKLWGIRFDPYSGPATALPWYVVSDGGMNIMPKSLGYDKRKVLHIGGASVGVGRGYEKYKSESGPRWGTNDYVRTASDGPSAYEIADVKFAGDQDRKSTAEQQVGNYVAGFTSAAKNYNKTVDQSDAVKNGTAAAGTLTGSSKMNSLTKTGFAATKMSTSASSGDFIPLETGLALRLRVFGRFGFGKDRFPAYSYTGKSYYRQNAASRFLWEYVFWPDQIKEQDDSRSRADRRDKLTDASKTLYDQMVASPTGKKVMPLRRTSLRVQPKKAKKPLPPTTDPFEKTYPTWKTQQKAFTSTFATYTNSKSGTGKDHIAKLAFDTAIQNTAKMLGGKGPDGKTPLLNTTALTAAQTEFNRAELMEGMSGRLLGAMRKTFGTTFVKALNIYQRLKTKFEAFLKGAKKRTSGGKIGKAIMKVGGVIFGAIIRVMLPQIRVMLPQIGAYLVDCVEQGFTSLLKKMMEVDFSDFTETVTAQITKKYEELAGQIEAKIESAAEAIKIRFGSIYDSVMDTWETAKTLLQIARHVFNVARLASCAAGGLETVGIACVVAGADYVLSLFDVSPSEYLLSHLLGSCVAQDLIKEFILGRSIIQNLPKQIAETIRKHVKDLLPEELKPLLCDQIGDAPDLPDAAEIPCEDIEDPYTGRGGSDLSRAPPGFPADMKRREATDAEIGQYGRLDRSLVDKSGRIDRSKLPEDFRKLLKPEDPPQPGTPEVWDPPGGSSPPTVREADPAPSSVTPKDPASDSQPSGGSDGQPGAGGATPQSVRAGKIVNPTSTVSVYLTVYPGASGGFPLGAGNGTTIFDVNILVQTSAIQTYGPLPIKIKVLLVERRTTGDYIRFLPDGPYVFSKADAPEVELDPAGRDGFWAKLSSNK